MNWISVKDELPPLDVLVLAVCFGDSIVVIRRSSNCDGQWWDYGKGVIRCDYITHWMPLPPLPNKQIAKM